jgi:lysophospholipase L1-like esterase
MNKHQLKVFAVFFLVFAAGFTWGVFAGRGKIFPFNQITAIQGYFAGGGGQPPAHDSYWYERTSFFDTFRTTAPIVMVGDSLTDGAEWREMFPQVSIANRGIDGDTAGGVLERMGGIVAVRAEKAFIMIGINDLAEPDKSADAVFDDYRKIIATLRDNGSAVFVVSTLMCNEIKAAWKSCSAANPKIKQLNRKLAALAPREITFIDINAKMTDASGLKDELTTDGVHLNGNGYLLWRDAISPFVLAGHKR